MAVTIDTGSVASRDRFDYWSAAQSRLFFPLDVTAPAGRPFTGRAHSFDLGPVRVRRVAAEGHGVRRTRRAIAADDPEQVELTLLLSGLQELAQGGRDTVLGPGGLVCMDSSHPYAVRSPERFEMLVFAVPTVLLRPHVDAVRGRTASALRGGLAGVVAPFLRSVGDGLLDGTVREDDGDLGESVVDLVRGLLAGRAREARRPDLLAEVKATIELRLHEPDLRPAAVAGAHFISTRYLHRLFEAEGVTVSEWIRLRRLERCRRDLEDPALADETVTTIARRWGLPNPGHFSRLFHAAYGCSPSAVRGRASARR